MFSTISTTTWTVAAAVLAALGVGAWAYKKKHATAAAITANPKAQYELGETAGYTAGFSDGAAKTAPKVAITAAQVDAIVKNPAGWMTDPKKARAAGYNVGYFRGYQDGLLGGAKTTTERRLLSDTSQGRVLAGPWVAPASAPTNWPAGCAWPPKSKAAMEFLIKAKDEFEKVGDIGNGLPATRPPHWWPDAWSYPPICPPPEWPAGKKWPPNKKEFDAFTALRSSMIDLMVDTGPRSDTFLFGDAALAASAPTYLSTGTYVAKTPCEAAFAALAGPLVYTSDEDRQASMPWASYRASYPSIADWGLALYNYGTPLEKWIASRIFNREADAAEAAGADATLTSNLRIASDCLAVPITSDDIPAEQKAILHLLDLPGTMYTDTLMGMEGFSGRKPWSPDGLNLWKKLHDQGYIQAAQDFRVLFSPDLSGDIGSSGSYGAFGGSFSFGARSQGTERSDPSTGFAPRPMLGGRISQEWKNQIPQWYFHDSFRSMRG